MIYDRDIALNKTNVALRTVVEHENLKTNYGHKFFSLCINLKTGKELCGFATKTAGQKYFTHGELSAHDHCPNLPSPPTQIALLVPVI